MTETCIADARRIAQLLPHRYPFLLVDKVIAFEHGKTLTAIKNVTQSEPHFTGHFPDNPVMPGVLILEAMAQASGLLVQLSNVDAPEAKPLYYLVKIDKARFAQIVRPGDQLRLEVARKRTMLKMGQFVCRALVDGVEVASAEIICAERAP